MQSAPKQNGGKKNPKTRRLKVTVPKKNPQKTSKLCM